LRTFVSPFCVQDKQGAILTQFPALAGVNTVMRELDSCSPHGRPPRDP